jgi:tRNA threonylcarbamoyladenosine biosynthesis protein TsaB
MRRLVIDTATSACSVALFDGDTLLAHRHEILGRGHAERLVPFISELPGCGKADAIFVNVGPGSFTGIRVGVAAARALAFSWKAECHGYNCLEFLAQIVRAQSETAAAVDVVTTGGHGEYYFQAFAASGAAQGVAQSLTPAAAAVKSDAPYVAGDVANLLCEMRGSGQPIAVYPDARLWPGMGKLAPLPASPTYVRGPDAKPPEKRAT